MHYNYCIWCVHYRNSINFSEWLTSKGYKSEFEDLSVEELAEQLREFYASLRTREGKPYSQSGYVSVRAGLNIYLTSPPFNKMINLMKDRVFQSAIQVFIGYLRAQGLDVTKNKRPGDFAKMYSTGILSNENPHQPALKSIRRALFALRQAG